MRSYVIFHAGEVVLFNSVFIVESWMALYRLSEFVMSVYRHGMGISCNLKDRLPESVVEDLMVVTKTGLNYANITKTK